MQAIIEICLQFCILGTIYYNTTMKKLTTSANLAALMDASGDTQLSLANKTGLQQSTIHRILKGLIKDPKLKQLIPICEYYNITLDALVGRDDVANQDAMRLMALFSELDRPDKHIFMLAIEAKSSQLRQPRPDKTTRAA
jgi:transcriptional regulator with XRE-family HTH domain